MAYVIKARARPAGWPDGHWVQVRWRSDDPWGAIWRCLYESLHIYMKWPPELTEHDIAEITLAIGFKPYKEDFVTTIFPKDPLKKHRKITHPKKRNSQHGKIPTD
jgi:hypothetical protein